MNDFSEDNFPPYQVYVHYMHKLLSDPSRVLEYAHNEEQAAELILSTLDSYGIPHELDKETILSAIPKKRYRKAKEIKWAFFEGTKDHIEAVIEDCRPFHIKTSYCKA